MSRVKVSELAYVRLRVPDIEKSARFLTDFGLKPTVQEDGKQYFRATDPMAYCYVLEQGPQRFLGFAFHAKSREDLELLSARHNAPIEKIDAPGGGERVRLKEPNDYVDVDVVFGIEPAPALDVPRQKVNTGHDPLARAGELYRLKSGAPTPIKRLAHVVLGSPLVSETVKWFENELGMLVSDEMVAGPQQKHIGSFIRIDEGDKFVDHHAVFIINYEKPGLNHISFEVPDFDAVLADHHYLAGKGEYTHIWGIGRHLLGAQVFDYWADPYGYPHEHWADTDRLTADVPPNTWQAHEAMVSQWGDEPPEAFKVAFT